MREQLVLRRVDAMAGQQRIILALACKHNVSITSSESARRGPVWTLNVFSATHWMCPYCPDPPAPKPPGPSVVKMWHDAGEP